MPRPPGASSDHFVDAEVCARAASRIERTYRSEELPRLLEAGLMMGSQVRADFQFSEFDGRPAVDGQLGGTLRLTCQRCLGPVEVELDEQFRVLIVDEECGDEPGGYEPVVAVAAHLDLRWLAEDQALLAMPLVARHEAQDCAAVDAPTEATPPQNEDGSDDETRQTPFQNLRDLMRKR